MKRSGLEWSRKDLKFMRRLADKKFSARIAAIKLGRSAGAVRHAAMVHGISFRSINRVAAWKHVQ